MNRHVNSIAGRLSLRPPQRESLEVLGRVCEIVPPHPNADLQTALKAIRSEFPGVTDFEREFPSLCFALATGVGKTRLMGASIAFLHLAHGLSNFFVLAPNLTIYNKLIGDFSPGTPKYVFKGISEFATQPPRIITGDNYESSVGGLDLFNVRINIFNIAKISSEVRGGRSPRIKKLSEFIGQSYFDYLSGLDDLVLLMDESHRYRASAGVRAINELKPVLGLEFTATPFVETGRGPIPFKNVILDYPLARAMEDGFVKEPAVVTRRDFSPLGKSAEEIERIKLEDGVRLHESVKVDLETYARDSTLPIVKPFLLVIARDTTHAAALVALVESPGFFEGRYEGKVLQVDSSRSGAEEEAMVERLLKVESRAEPTEIVIHVNMLKEGWDVTNLYTIVPLRAANARILIEQSIGRGLRLPYGKRTGEASVDTLNIIAHDKFQEIVDDARRDDSPIRLKTLVLDGDQGQSKTQTIVSQSQLATQLGLGPDGERASTSNGSNGASGTASAPQVLAGASNGAAPAFASASEQAVAQVAFEVMQELERRKELVPGASHLQKPEVQKIIEAQVRERMQPAQLELDGLASTSSEPDIAQVVAKTAQLVAQQTIDIPRIAVVPKDGQNARGLFQPFTLDLTSMNYQVPSQNLHLQEMRTDKSRTLELESGGVEEARLEDYVVSGLIGLDDVSYDDHADLLYDLAGQVVQHFQSRPEEETRAILRAYQTPIAGFVHAQMQHHFVEEAVDYEVKVSRGFSTLKASAYTAPEGEAPRDFRQAPPDKNNIARYVFGGFSRCLYPLQKFQSDAERKLAVILERESQKWFRPAKGQFQIIYKLGVEHLEYIPDFVAETSDTIWMLEPKARNQMDAPDVLAKRDAAILWCGRASEWAASYGGKPWSYALIPHDVIAENMALETLASLRMKAGK